MSFDHPFWMVLEFEGAKRFKVCFLNCNNVSMDYVEAIWSSCSFVLQVPFFENMVSACNTSRGKGYTREKLQELG
jgi:hypothetical protein